MGWRFGLLGGLVAAVVALVPLACGGDDGDTVTVTSGDEAAAPEATTTPADVAERSEFIQQADAICKELNKQAEAFQDAETLSQLAEDVEAAEQLTEDGIARMRELEPPTPELATSFDQFLAAVEDQTAVLSQVENAASAGDVQAVQSLTDDLERARDRKSDIAINAGFAECGSG